MPNSLSSHRVAVTGASGFIGMQLLRALHQAGAGLVAIVAADRSTARLDTLPFPVETIIVHDVARIGDAIRQAAPHFVVHLNGHITTQRTLESLEKTLLWNLTSTVSLLTAAAEVGVARVIMMGSCEEYGQIISPFDPALAPDPNSPYGASKAAATAYARLFTTSFKLPTVVLRPSVVYGPGQSLRMLISQVMKALAENRSIDVTLGEQTRDFVYIDDVVQAILLSLTLPGIEGKVWNVGSDEVVLVHDCLQLIERITGRHGLIHYGGRPYEAREIFRYELINQPTYDAFHWKPTVMLEEGLRRTWKAFLAAS